MITDERITELWNLASNTATSKPDWTYSEIIFATVRAAIAEHDVELRKQEPVGYWHVAEDKDECDFRLGTDISGDCPDCLPLYATPMPPEQTGDALVEGMYQKMWKDFVSLQRGDAKQICVEAELYRKSLTAPTPPTPSQQESVPKGFIVVSKDLLAEAIACNTDASLAEARHIINSVLKVSDDEIFREVLKEQTK